MGPLDHVWAIVSVPDNIPIVLMLGLVAWLVRLAFREARANDRLAREGRPEEIARRMQE